METCGFPSISPARQQGGGAGRGVSLLEMQTGQNLCVWGGGGGGGLRVDQAALSLRFENRGSVVGSGVHREGGTRCSQKSGVGSVGGGAARETNPTRVGQRETFVSDKRDLLGWRHCDHNACLSG